MNAFPRILEIYHLSASFVHVCCRRGLSLACVCVLPKALQSGWQRCGGFSVVEEHESGLQRVGRRFFFQASSPSGFEGIQRTAEHVLVSLGPSCSSSLTSPLASHAELSIKAISNSAKKLQFLKYFLRAFRGCFFREQFISI